MSAAMDGESVFQGACLRSKQMSVFEIRIGMPRNHYEERRRQGILEILRSLSQERRVFPKESTFRNSS